MDYIIIYEFEPKSLQIYTLLIPIGIIIVGIIGFMSIRKHGFIRLPLMPPNPFTQPYMNKFTEFFISLFIVFGVIALVGLSIGMLKQFSINREINKSNSPKTITVSEESKIGVTSIYENIGLKKSFIINGQIFKFAKTANINGSDWPPEIFVPRENNIQKLKISFITFDKENLILKIEEKTTSANQASD